MLGKGLWRLEDEPEDELVQLDLQLGFEGRLGEAGERDVDALEDEGNLKQRQEVIIHNNPVIGPIMLLDAHRDKEVRIRKDENANRENMPLQNQVSDLMADALVPELAVSEED